MAHDEEQVTAQSQAVREFLETFLNQVRRADLPGSADLIRQIERTLAGERVPAGARKKKQGSQLIDLIDKGRKEESRSARP